jgi:hypothetical protein
MSIQEVIPRAYEGIDLPPGTTIAWFRNHNRYHLSMQAVDRAGNQITSLKIIEYPKVLDDTWYMDTLRGMAAELWTRVEPVTEPFPKWQLEQLEVSREVQLAQKVLAKRTQKGTKQ